MNAPTVRRAQNGFDVDQDGFSVDQDGFADDQDDARFRSPDASAASLQPFRTDAIGMHRLRVTLATVEPGVHQLSNHQVLVATQHKIASGVMRIAAATGEMSPLVKKLVAAQDLARNDPDNAPVGVGDAMITRCNYAVFAVAKTMGAPLAALAGADGKPVLANQMTVNLAASSQWVEVTAAQAQSAANAGQVVIAAARADGHGHVTTIRPAGVDEAVKAGGSGILMNNVGKHIWIARKSWCFFNEQTVRYYTPK